MAVHSNQEYEGRGGILRYQRLREKPRDHFVLWKQLVSWDTRTTHLQKGVTALIFVTKSGAASLLAVSFHGFKKIEECFRLFPVYITPVLKDMSQTSGYSHESTWGGRTRDKYFSTQ